MDALLIRDARVLTMLSRGENGAPPGGLRGAAMSELGVLASADVLIESGRVAGVWPRDTGGLMGVLVAEGVREIFARQRVLMPGFVDCHTHACWAGSRVDEWERKLAGATYQEIAASGGGIMSTVRAVRAATRDSLFAATQARALAMLVLGTTTVEIKTGYGLTLSDELKMLAAIRDAGSNLEDTGPEVVPTGLLGHAIDPDVPAFVEEVIDRILPAMSSHASGVAIDAFCEKGAWSLDDCTRLFNAAQSRGHAIRVHADQFTSMGMVERAIQMGARSVDHLEASTDATLAALAASQTFAVGLPVCGFHLDGRYANLKRIVELGGKVCVATNYNPGSAPCPSMPLALALAVRHCGLTPAQAIVAGTLNPALLLGFSDRGYIARGARADLLLLKHTDERALVYEVGDNPVDTVIVGGKVMSRALQH